MQIVLASREKTKTRKTKTHLQCLNADLSAADSFDSRILQFSEFPKLLIFQLKRQLKFFLESK